MAPSDRPLLAGDRAPSENSDQNAEEEDALLTGQRTANGSKYGLSFWRELGIFVWALVATTAVIVLAVAYQHQQTSHPKDSDGLKSTKPSGKRNLIFMVSDGMGPTSLSLTRSFRQYQSGLPIDDILVLDQHLIGSSRTRSSSSLITDSAAGATAFSCGLKSYNGAISITPDKKPCGTILEAAKKAGYTTGLVVTTRITDATPACFAAHVNMRTEESSIARQLVGDHPLGHVVDLMLGGGRCFFLPNETQGGCRTDNIDVIKMAKDKGYKYIDDRKSFDNLNIGKAVKLPLLGLFAPRDIPYEIDRRSMEDTYPSLDEMARTAMNALQVATRDKDKGFFLMIEGSRIDHAGHANDPAAQVHEVLAYDKAFSSVLDFLENDDVEGVAVSTSDHETGGLATAKQLHEEYPKYLWYPEVLAKVSHSGENLGYKLHHYLREQQGHSDSEIEEFVRDLLHNGLGISDASDEEVSYLLKNVHDLARVVYKFNDMVSRRSQTGWSTHGHSAADVNIYSSNPSQAAALVGNHENTEVGNFLRDYLELDLEPITEQLQQRRESSDMLVDDNPKPFWLDQPVVDKATLEMDHYHGEFKRSLDCGCSH